MHVPMTAVNHAEDDDDDNQYWHHPSIITDNNSAITPASLQQWNEFYKEFLHFALVWHLNPEQQG